MQAENISKKAFLLLFTRELILNSMNQVSVLKNIISEEGKAPLPKPAAKIPERKDKKQVEESKEPLIKSILSKPPVEEKNPAEVSIMKPVHINPPRREIADGIPRKTMELRIPEPRLPPEFQYLQPTPTKLEVDLGKLNPLIMDGMVQTIECEGPDKPVIVSGGMGRKPSNVILSNQEIEEIIQKVSRSSRIPADKGVYRVVIGHLIFSAVISDVVPSRFRIRKMRTPMNFPQPYRVPNPNLRLYFRK